MSSGQAYWELEEGWRQLLRDLHRRNDFDTARLIERWHQYHGAAPNANNALDALMKISETECIKHFGVDAIERRKKQVRDAQIDTAVRAMADLTIDECHEALARRFNSKIKIR